MNKTNIVDERFGFYSYYHIRIKSFLIHKVVLERSSNSHEVIKELKDVSKRTGWKFQIGVLDIDNDRRYLFFIPKKDKPHQDLYDMFANSKNVIRYLWLMN